MISIKNNLIRGVFLNLTELIMFKHAAPTPNTASLKILQYWINNANDSEQHVPWPPPSPHILMCHPKARDGGHSKLRGQVCSDSLGKDAHFYQRRGWRAAHLAFKQAAEHLRALPFCCNLIKYTRLSISPRAQQTPYHNVTAILVWTFVSETYCLSVVL